ncbi:DUF1540 domain-containing protein [Deinococcus maricopensis]|uniref:DUF1540 domain-containing protein n=1 Tax=Deinococcus maricopensis (strain DSM 21211 / LMG 22137 / NRRL B-23946 / LB-34) TaxID=709986 RepID=E8U3J3_DEIML|nr:DUF1540 domain-containing protein [Deinococcus maricopensis]ADV68617.1 protein of unknown function DUF1540 [Deinococcus maricopensis DSM 21211]
MTNDTTSIVGTCTAEHCRYNEAQRCTAGQIEVSMDGAHAACATFTPRTDATDQPQPGTNA